ncbi:TolC family protein [Microbaculum marinisediminis]|uniref:Protein CyaE n=1 Tax=Microbaculum marinisediminis TaxID=2931392 RepID=A0AAW5QYF7_9HYPH|nr:TolC family protein [Microbaculum sp. A6E488]MCT8972962.1 TolC family protein [Microbaculum sp. A6E488]
MLKIVCARVSRTGGLLLIAGLLAGCMNDSLKEVPVSPTQPWNPEASAVRSGDYSIPANPAVASLEAGIQSGRVYTLPELIDLAQRTNPATRIAWEEARQAALAVGMVEASFLPLITANVIGGEQAVVTPVPNLVGGTDYISTTANGIAPNLALQWLVFDFGQRQALQEAAEHTAYAANVGFNGTHQALIYNVTRSYYLYGAAQGNLAIARQALANSRQLQQAAEARYGNGTGTSIEVAQARQLAAQSNLRLVQAQDSLRDSYQDLLGAVGISPKSTIKIASSAGRGLPRARSLPTDDVIEAALSRRPDVLASYAAVKASQANARAAEADFLPKVYLGAVVATDNTSLQTGNLPKFGAQASTSGVLAGVTIPIYDGGLREANLRRAESTSAAAHARFEQTRDTAVREIVVASDTLRSALEAYVAASELVGAATVTHDAAFEAYRNGVGTITDATAAATGLLDARQARSDAHAAALVAASSLAFSLGAMTSRESPDQALRN